jgi:hypothetical protein
MQIAGYFITYKRLCIVLENDKPEVDKQIRLFLNMLAKCVKKFTGDSNTFFDIEDIEKVIFTDADLLGEVLKEYQAIDDYLVRLITGRPVNIPYYDPYLERLKIITHAADFCSVADYLGAESPVLVKLIERDCIVNYITGASIKNLKLNEGI